VESELLGELLEGLLRKMGLFGDVVIEEESTWRRSYIYLLYE